MFFCDPTTHSHFKAAGVGYQVEHLIFRKGEFVGECVKSSGRDFRGLAETKTVDLFSAGMLFG
jgi:hypothetical protein